MKKKRGKGQEWKLFKTFESTEEANRELQSLLETAYSKSTTKHPKNGQQVFLKCKGYPYCPHQLHLYYPAASTNAILYEINKAHIHETKRVINPHWHWLMVQMQLQMDSQLCLVVILEECVGLMF